MYHCIDYSHVDEWRIFSGNLVEAIETLFSRILMGFSSLLAAGFKSL
jgi:hypothetical protein